MSRSIGIVAGSGSLPLEMLESAKKEGYSVHVCAVKNEAEGTWIEKADSFEWVRLGELGKLVKYFQSKGVSELVFGGKIQKFSLLKGEVRPDLTLVTLFAKIKDRKDDTLLGTIANFLTEKGLKVLESTRFLKESLPGSQVLTTRKPDSKEWENIHFGFEVAKAIAGLDIGQTVVVKDHSVVAIESVEGTNACIRRGGELGGGKVTVIKVAKPKQDMRFDVPAVGCETLEALKEADAKTFVIEAGKTIVLDFEKFIERANQMKLSVVSFEGKET